MKRLLLVIATLFTVSVAHADSMPILVKDAVEDIGPTKTTMTIYATSATPVNISAGAVGVRNCLTKLDVSPTKTGGSTSYTINLLDGGTTTYSVNASTLTNISVSWPETYPWCTSPKTAATITGTSMATGIGVVVDVNYQGYSR